ncbi:50S ribosomal protein L3 [Rickettsia prowazekii]|uniref:Large ribosomal subunit protein uL3 n=2 Tax=Rickettsia prowazekii TaxID=782 RepID=RL3_RICPR|nr:50S ribosomal protein L3 [Rickettsia prowazekii]P48952.2 RecName: Full=Large ribosomal subunit protein uL3; AltName: Full=50S ribosomal protein L3 [Rickettsia prowazekii str. Madrid E]EOB10613.1 30S ribosomal protein S10 [Rickettsia prowazekii str. GvF12]ADE30202.1 50S ribosomal protein L3 [Rickettsia prowazekii str. Rp22]AFE49459.1 50S ribosomal protein L3 [Rickettsia prowazekii str. Chernikova]AFE50303.1 50S ribosomal protein L3 [Rickettsia prowazekii str. Katsinyian]AFE51149.1 50S ribos
MRTGIIAQKVGMTSVFNDKGERISLTLVKVDDCQVVGHKTLAKHGYNALVIGVKDQKISKVTKPMKQVFANAKIAPKTKLKEFRISEDNFIDIASILEVDHFRVGQFVDITATTIGKGFAGSMKRHNFRGLEASHGVSISHRSHGSTGQRQDPGKVFKGKKMAGHMGCNKVTIQNLKIFAVDTNRKLIMIQGSIPGHKNSYLLVKDAIKKAAITIA